MLTGTLSEPTLSVSPWFEARRTAYYDALFGVSARGDWDTYIAFFAEGIKESAHGTLRQMLALVEVQESMRQVIRESSLRAETAFTLVDHAVANPSFTVDSAAHALDVSQNHARQTIRKLTELGVLVEIDPSAYRRRYFAPAVLNVLLGRSATPHR